MKKLIILLIFILSYSQDKSISKTEFYRNLPKAYQLWIDGDFDKSLDLFLKLKNSELNNYNIALIYFLKNEYQQSLEYCNKAIAFDSKSFHAYHLKAKNYWKLNQRDQARLAFEKSLDIDDSQSYILLDAANFYFEENNFDKAYDLYSDCVNENNNFIEAYGGQVAILTKRNKYIDAYNIVKKIVYENFQEGRFTFYAAQLLQAMKKKDEEIKLWKEYQWFYPQGSLKTIANQRLKALKSDTVAVYFNSKNLSNTYTINLGESFKYGVSYGFNLGGMTMEVDKDAVIIDGKKCARVLYQLESSNFLLSLNATFEAFIDFETITAVRSYLISNEGNEIDNNRMYIFDSKKNRFIARNIQSGGRLEYIEKEMPVNATDGTAVLYYARALVSNRLSMPVITIIDEHFKRTDISVKKETKKEFVLNKEMDFVYLEAQARYKGIAGMTGYAEGYFSNDNYVIPMIGKMQIIVGKVRVELKK